MKTISNITISDMVSFIRKKRSFVLGPIELQGSVELRATSWGGAGDVDADGNVGVDRRVNYHRGYVRFEVETNGRKYTFEAEISPLSTPKALEKAIDENRTSIKKFYPSFYPMVVAPYLSEENLNLLAEQKVSGLDLCGNGVLVAEDLWIYKSGQKNLYPRSIRLRNAYSGKSSLIGRAFLVKPEFDSVTALVAAINDYSAKISFPQVSKVLQQLDEDLMVSREEGGLKLLQPDKLLDALREEYKPARITTQWQGRCNLPSLESLFEKIRVATYSKGNRLVKTGVCSAPSYAPFGGEPMLSIYTDAPFPFLMNELERLGPSLKEEKRFANLELFQTSSDWVYYNTGLAAINNQPGEATLVQSYLEMSKGDKRQQEAAEQIREKILATFPGRK